MTLNKILTLPLVRPISVFALLAAGSAFADQPVAATATQPNALMQVLQDGDNSRLKALLKQSDANAKDVEGTPLIMNAVLFGDAEALRLFLDHGADPNATNAAGATALLWAAGDPERANLLLEHGADIHVKSVLGRTPLLAAASQEGAGSIVAMLLARGAAIEVKDVLKGQPTIWRGAGQSTPVIDAARARDGEALELLIASGADVNAKDANGGNALSEAVAFGNVDNVGVLLERGVDANVRVTGQQYTPLMLAAMSNNIEIATMLIAAGADVNAQDLQGSSVVMWAAYGAETNDPRVLQLLLAAGADPSVPNRKQETAESWAKWHGAISTVTLLRQTEGFGRSGR